MLLWGWINGDGLISGAREGLLSPSYDPRDDLAAYTNAVYREFWILKISSIANVSVVHRDMLLIRTHI